MAAAFHSSRSSARCVGALLACLFLGCVVVGHASTNILKSGQVAEKDVEANLAKELAAVGAGAAADRRVQALQDSLQSMYQSLPKDADGLLGHQAVRYALHRFFAHHRGWFIRGLEPGSELRTSTPAPAPLAADGAASGGGGGSGGAHVGEWVPSFLQDLHEKHLKGRGGTNLKALAALAATLEDLVDQEATGRLDTVYDIHRRARRSLLTEEEADEIISTYYVGFLLAGNFSASSPREAERKKVIFAAKYAGWPEAEEWLRELEGKELTQGGHGSVTFKAVSHVVNAIGEEYYKFNDLECSDLKSTLRGLGGRKPGRVRLSAFYSKALYTHWRFTEKVDYLRTLGALDESDPKQPFVIIANYAMARPNCLDSSNLYAICCRNECEDLMGHLERSIGAAAAPPEQIASLVASLSSPTVEAPRNLSAALLGRLSEVAAHHSGEVPLHGRLFAQWMHHAFPMECPYPHEAGSINPQTPDEWIKETGKEERASAEEMMEHVERDTCAVNHQGKILCAEETAELPWNMNEELLTSPLRSRVIVDRPSTPPSAPPSPSPPRGLGLLAARRPPADTLGALAAAVALALLAAARWWRGLSAAKEEDLSATCSAGQSSGQAWQPLFLVLLLALAACAAGLLDQRAFLYAVFISSLLALAVRTPALPAPWARRLKAAESAKCNV